MKTKLCLLFFILCAMLSGCTSAQNEQREVPELLEPVGVELDFAAAQIRNLYTVNTYSAAVVPHVEEMYFTVDGIVEDVFVSLGSSVRKGDPLITLDEDALLEQEERLAEELTYTRQIHANANRMAELDIQIAKLQLENMKLSEADNIALSQAQTAIDLQELRLRQTREEQQIAIGETERQLEDVRAKIGQNVLIAPFDGTIIAINDLRTDYNVSAYDPILQIADDSRMRVEGEFVSQSILESAHEIYALIGDEKYPLEYIPLDMTEYLKVVFGGGTLRTQFSFVQPPEDVSCGDYAAVCIVTGYVENALTVPANAVYTDSAGRYVYRLDGEQRVRVNVHTGLSNSLYIQITDGLEEGDMVYVKE